MGGTVRIAGKLFGGLEGFRTGEARPAEIDLDRAALAGKPAREVGDRIIDAVCPVDGSQDTELRSICANGFQALRAVRALHHGQRLSKDKNVTADVKSCQGGAFSP
jgi:hypothetical protein